MSSPLAKILPFALVLAVACRRESSPPAPAPAAPHAAVTEPSRPDATTTTIVPTSGFPGVELLASCAGMTATGKRHQSYVFTFRVVRALAGTFSAEEYTSQELFHDFGGRRLMDRLGMESPGSCRHRGILKLVRDGAREAARSTGVASLAAAEDGGAAEGWRLLWAAREDEADTFRALEFSARALVDAVDRSDMGLVRPFLAPGSNLSSEDLVALGRERRGYEAATFAAALHTSLLEERDGLVAIGHGAERYGIALRRDGPSTWRVGQITWTRR